MANPNPSPSTRFKPGNKLGGRRPQPFAKAIAEVVTEEEARAIVRAAVELAKAGDARARQWLADRADGKAVARVEQGEPGDFDVSLEAVRRVLRIIPGH